MCDTKDREFQLINGNTGDFYSCKIKPQLVLAEARVEHGILHVTIPGKEEILINKEEVKKRNDIRPTMLDSFWWSITMLFSSAGTSVELTPMTVEKRFQKQCLNS